MARCQWRPDRTSNAIPPCKAVGHLPYLLDKNMYYEYALRPRTSGYGPYTVSVCTPDPSARPEPNEPASPLCVRVICKALAT